MRLITAFALALFALACKSTPEPGPEKQAALTAQELQVAEQNLTNFRVRFVGQLQSPVEATVEKAQYELVVEGKVVKSGEAPLNVPLTPDAPASITVEETGQYVASKEELQALSETGGALLVALRGKLLVRRGGKVDAIDFARSRDVRVPRMPTVKLHDLDAGRFSAEEAQIYFRLGVVNPNPFPVKMSGLTYQVLIAGKPMGDGTLGSGEKVDASSTGVFDLQVVLTKDSYGPDIVKMIKSLRIPYELKGELKGDLLGEPYEIKNEIKLNPPR